MKKLLKSLFGNGEELPSQVWNERRPIRQANCIVVVITQFNNPKLISTDFLSNLDGVARNIGGFFCATLLPLPFFFKQVQDVLPDTDKEVLQKIVRLDAVRVAITFGPLDVGPLGYPDRLVFGAIGNAVVRAFKAAMHLDDKSSWCDRYLADLLSLGHDGSELIGGEELVRIRTTIPWISPTLNLNDPIYPAPDRNVDKPSNEPNLSQHSSPLFRVGQGKRVKGKRVRQQVLTRGENEAHAAMQRCDDDPHEFPADHAQRLLLLRRQLQPHLEHGGRHGDDAVRLHPDHGLAGARGGKGIGVNISWQTSAGAFQFRPCIAASALNTPAPFYHVAARGDERCKISRDDEEILIGFVIPSAWHPHSVEKCSSRVKATGAIAASRFRP
jgi:hypothetical protein